MERPESVEARWTQLDPSSEAYRELVWRIRNSCYALEDRETILEDIEDQGITVEDAWHLYTHMGLNQAQPNVEYFPLSAYDIQEAIKLRIARDELKNKLE